MQDNEKNLRFADSRQSGSAPVSRRRFLQSTVAGAGAMALVSRGGSAQTPQASPAPAPGIYPSTGPGVPDAFLTFPAPFKSVEGVPGNGGTVSILGGTQLPPITPRDQNTYWQELDKRMGVTTDRQLVPFSEYPQKMAALLASDDVPDLTLVRVSLAPDLSRAIVQGAFTDLTPYLTGDALSEYPNLALLPDYTYKYAQINEKLYGLPFQNFRVGNNLLMYRQDWVEALGFTNSTNADEVFELIVAMSKGDPDGNGTEDTFGLGADSNLLASFIQGMFRVPNGWRLNDDGTLTAAHETDEFQQSLEFARRLWEAGAYHPDSGSMTRTQMQDLIIGGKIGMHVAQPQEPYAVRAPRNEILKINPNADLQLMLPPGHDGGQAVTWNNTAVNGLLSIPSRVGNDEERVRELLRIVNYHAAPFGSEEYLFINFGFEGEQHTRNENGQLSRTEKGQADVNEIPATFFPTRVYNFPSSNVTEEGILGIQEITKDMLEIGIDNPTWTAYSETQATQAGVLNQFAIDSINGIVTGRQPLEALATYREEWKGRGGDQIRSELEEYLSSHPA